MCLFDHSLAYFGNWLTLKFHSTMNVLNEGFLHFYWNSRKEQIIFSFFKYFIYLFLERGEGSEKERERNMQEIYRLVASHRTPNGDLACNPGMCPDWESNQ